MWERSVVSLIYECFYDHSCIGCRFTKKLPDPPASSSVDVPVSCVIIALFRMRCGADGPRRKEADDDPLFALLLRFLHAFSQVAEVSMNAAAVVDCPDPSLRDRMHPYQAASRRKGNPSLKIHTVNQFQARGGGFVSVKDEVSLHDWE